jgi:hypothetical protein
MEVLTVKTLKIEQLDAGQSALSSLFQFMIGNTDWSSLSGPEESCCHNGIPLGFEGTTTGRVVLPYDFDQVGLINAVFARPPMSLRLSSVRQRLYRGLCAKNDEVEWAVEQIKLNRAEVEGAFDTDTVSQRSRSQALDYMRSGYEIINDPDRLKSDVLDRCRE